MTDKTKNIIIRGIDMDEYIRAFKFGIKLVVLLSCLAVPIIIGVAISSGVNAVMEKIPALYTPALRITCMQDFKPDDLTGWRTLGLTSGKTIYYTISRPMDVLKEYDKVTTEVVSLINNKYSVKPMHVIDKDTKAETGIIYDYPDFYGTAIYGQNTQLGTFIIVPINIALFIICLALYFPLFKAIFNLFRRKKPKESA